MTGSQGPGEPDNKHQEAAVPAPVSGSAAGAGVNVYRGPLHTAELCAAVPLPSIQKDQYDSRISADKTLPIMNSYNLNLIFCSGKRDN